MWSGRSSFTSLVVGVFVVYVAHTCWVMYGIVYTRPCAGGGGCIRPYLARRPKLQLSVYTATRSSLGAENNVDLVLNVEDFDVESKFERTVNVSVPKKTRNNGTLYAYIFLHHAGVLPWHDGKQVHLVSPLTTYMVPKPEEVNLLTGESATQQQLEAEKKPPSALDEPVSHWRPRLTLNVMVEDFVFDGASLPADVHRYMKMIQLGKTVHYLPILFIDQLSNRVKDLMVINRSSTELPLTVAYDKISLGRLRFWIHMQDAVYSLQQFGFSEKDADEVKGIFVDTNLYFLALTFFVAAFHLLFDFLAFKNDISFWKKKKSMIGMSTKAVLWRCFSTVVIFLFLLDEQTSLLVLVPAGVGAAIELWKVKKALKMTVLWRGLRPTFQRVGEEDGGVRHSGHEVLVLPALPSLHRGRRLLSAQRQVQELVLLAHQQLRQRGVRIRLPVHAASAVCELQDEVSGAPALEGLHLQGFQHVHRRRLRLHHHHAHVPPAGVLPGRRGIPRVPLPAVALSRG
ncbi:cleft lip and palate transmembrane protein 1-like protein isoform X3 [Meles meles]|uniref:cleft lip and palate transmembrane protein 1-like protein isoform X3 n=1 Tax=Meles meles TaxID=9662 RepID=UPI001E69B248|nr:cleft lip and palate transmembrane protein 1-like protein isoform X3 [Meles meles]